MTRAHLCVAALAATSALTMAQDGWRLVPIEPPDGHDASVFTACRTDNGGAPLRMGSSSPTDVEALCAAPAIARCDVAGVEPIDIDVTALCRGRHVTFTPVVRAVVPDWAVRAPATVEWRAWADSVSRVLAVRQVDPQAVEPWGMGREARLLRVLRPEASPVTLFVPEASSDPLDVAVSIPAPLPGGELVMAMGEAERQMPSLVLRGGAQARVIEINGAAIVAVPGLPAGDYEIVFGSNDVPIGRVMPVRVVAGETIEVVPRLPVTANEYRITGVVTLNGTPLSRHPLEVVHLSTDKAWAVTSDDRGRYSLSVPEAGAYLVRLQLEHDLGYAEVDRPVALGENIIDLDLTGVDLEISLLRSGTPFEGPVSVILDGPVNYAGTVDGSESVRLQVLPAGTYVVRASMPPDIVSTAVTVSLDLAGGTRRVSLDLREQTATLRVPDTPDVRARAGQQILRALAEGVFDVRRVSPGTEILVRAPGRVPACLVLAPDAENIVSPGQALGAVTFMFEGTAALRVPPGRVRLSDVDRCTVPLEEFEWRRVEGGFEITNLPYDVPVTFEYGSRTFAVRAPSGPVIVK